ncbi:MAG: DUF4274 domain-containing protein [Candidatus Dojkabacteria bacterium]|nr:DUF4274 domain-containing protein [Candidatus Dojkabacteria bacterium]
MNDKIFEKVYTKAYIEFFENSTPEQWHQSVVDFNNAIGAKPLLWLAKNPETDKATILMIYWYILLIIGGSKFKDIDKLFGWQKDWKKAADLIEKNYSAGFYKNSNIAYDPKDENGTDWTKKFTDSDIPKELFQAVKGKKVKELVLHEGIPEAVLELVPDEEFEKEKSIPRSAKSIKEFGETEYWLYGSEFLSYKNAYVQARLISTTKTVTKDGISSFSYGSGKNAILLRSPLQEEPYAGDPKLVYEVNPKHPRPDNYKDSHGFTLYSKRLIDLMREFKVDSEYFPVKIVDREGNVLVDYDYYVFHPLMKTIDALDNAKTKWSGDRYEKHNGIYLDMSKLKDRPPLFLLADMYRPFMRNDLKEAIRKRGIAGFRFLHPIRHKGEIMTEYDD